MRKKQRFLSIALLWRYYIIVTKIQNSNHWKRIFRKGRSHWKIIISINIFLFPTFIFVLFLVLSPFLFSNIINFNFWKYALYFWYLTFLEATHFEKYLRSYSLSKNNKLRVGRLFSLRALKRIFFWILSYIKRFSYITVHRFNKTNIHLTYFFPFNDTNWVKIFVCQIDLNISGISNNN